jgi:uncharacterized coiled-coil protein SlyX
VVEQAKTWIKENSTLVYFLIAQAIAAGAVAFSLITYMVNLEARVSTLETRGSPHLSTIDNRLTVLESQTKTNKDSIERIVDVMTKKLNINP